MRTIDIQAYEDRTRPSGGYAAISLSGVTGLPDGTTFMLRPVDSADAHHDLAHWPTEAQVPVELRVNADTTELIIGPALVANPMLVPGTPVRIDLPSEGVSGEFLWPHVTPAARPRRRTLAPTAKLPETLAAVATSPLKSGTPIEPIVVAAAAMTATPANRSVEEIDMTNTLNEVPARDATARGRSSGAVPAPTAARVEPAPATDAASVFYAHARAGFDGKRDGDADAAPRSFVDTLPQSRRGAAALAVAGLLALQGTAYALMSARTVEPPASPAAIIAAPSATTQPLPISVVVYDTLAVGDTSPLGNKAAGVAPARMLELAHTNLFEQGASRDTAEAAFWLKHYMATTFGDERARRVLTQLGSTYATPTRGAPDYILARQAWEISAAYGDPYAMCFIARLHDAGLGGAVDKAAAALWNERARAAGGCK